jgi:hypothetical protein
MSNTEQGQDASPILKEVIHKDSPLKDMILSYIGEMYEPENDEVTVEMIVDVMAAEFPEFVLALAEENFFRGYEQALNDLGQMQLAKDTELSEDSTNGSSNLRLVTDDEQE